MAVDVKAVALRLAESNAKVLIHEVLKPLAAEKIAENPALAAILLPFLDQVEALLLVAADKIDNVQGN